MLRNLEVKAKLASVGFGEEIARSIDASYHGVLNQVDTYFNVQHGRLKLREINGNQAELIFYKRTEVSRNRESNFTIVPCQEPLLLREILAASLGIRAVVRKNRVLFMYGSTRIHLDEVDRLGSFLEIEAPVEQNLAKARKVVDFLVKMFQLRGTDFLLHSYVDMILAID